MYSSKEVVGVISRLRLTASTQAERPMLKENLSCWNVRRQTLDLRGPKANKKDPRLPTTRVLLCGI